MVQPIVIIKSLETKIPPLVLAALFVFGMWLVNQYLPESTLNDGVRLSVAIGLSSLGALTLILGVVSFSQTKTTINPLRPEQAEALVVTGIYQYTSNPMYLGLFCILLAWGVFLTNGFSLILAILFMPAMNFLQIIPEERAMELNFREHYTTYKAKVRRWL